MLNIQDLTFRIVGRPLFEGASLVLPEGHKAGLVGRNGSGKTTLFNLISGQLHADDGTISIRKRTRIGRVAQDAPGGSRSLLDTVLSADLELAKLSAEAETASDPGRIADIHNRLADIDAHTAPARAASILAGLGFDEEAQQRACSDFSGGWRMRVALASTLFARPDFMLLDEPSNHLDLEATIWLESYLANWRGTLLIISHERDLLNKVVDEIAHVENGKLNRYAGGYDRFERTRRERLELQHKANKRQQMQRDHIQSFIDRFRAQANKARQAQSRIKMLQRLEPVASMIEEWTPSFDFPSPGELAPPLIMMEKMDVGYEPGKPILKNLNLRIDMDDRIALIGANGNGKTTLARLIAGRLKAETGTMRASAKLRIGYFSQHQTEELDEQGTPVDHMARLMPGATPTKVRTQLGRFGFGDQRATTSVRDLSGGEKARLLFALMTRDAPHMIILDEPTNHLDVDAREALIHALNAYKGAVILVSHDTRLVSLVADRLWWIGEGGCRNFDGDMDDYRRKLLENKRNNGRADMEPDKEKRKEQRRARAAARTEAAPLRKKIKVMEKKLDALAKDKKTSESKLANPKLYDGPAEEVTRLQIHLADTNRKIGKKEEEWLEATSALETALDLDS